MPKDTRYSSLTHIPPKLDACMTVRGEFDIARIPPIPWSLIIPDTIPEVFPPEEHGNEKHSPDFTPYGHTHDAADIISGIFDLARIPYIPWSWITDKPDFYPPEGHVHIASDIISGVFDILRIPYIPWSWITDKPSYYPPEEHEHDASDIISGILDELRIPHTWIIDFIINALLTVKDLIITGKLPNVDYDGYYVNPIPVPSNVLSPTPTEISSPWRIFAPVGSTVLSIEGGMLGITTGTVSADRCGLAWQHNPLNPPTWDKNFVAAFCYWAREITNIIATIGRGTNDYGATDYTRFVGFYQFGSSLYGLVANGSARSVVSLQSISAGTYYRLKVEFTAGTSAKFYVNEVYRGQITTNLPSGQSNANDLSFHVRTTTSASRKIVCNEIRLNQLP